MKNYIKVKQIDDNIDFVNSIWLFVLYLKTLIVFHLYYYFLLVIFYIIFFNLSIILYSKHSIFIFY